MAATTLLICFCSSSKPSHHSPRIDATRQRLDPSDSAEEPLIEEDTEKEESVLEEGEIAPANEENTVVTLLKKVSRIK